VGTGTAGGRRILGQDATRLCVRVAKDACAIGATIVSWLTSGSEILEALANKRSRSSSLLTARS